MKYNKNINKQRRKKTTNKVVSINSRRYVKKEERTTRAVLIIIVFFVTVSGIGTIHNLITREVLPTTSVSIATINNPRLTEGIIIRNETAYYTNFSGEISFLVDDNTRVRQNALIATVSNVATIEPLLEENQQLANQILSLQNIRAPFSIHTEDVGYINNQIREITNNNLHRLGNFVAVRSLSEELNAHVYTRNTLLLSENIGILEPYVTQSMQNLSLISSNQREVRSNYSGIVSLTVDGLEHLNPSNMRYLTSQFSHLPLPLSHGSSGGVFKIVKSNTWYLASFIEPDKALALNQNSTITIYIEDGENFREVNATVYALENREEYVFVIFSIRDFMLDYINKRSINFKLENGEVTGFKVPYTSLVNRTFLMIPMSYIIINEDAYLIEIIGNEGIKIPIIPVTIRNQQTTEGYIYILQDFNNIQLGDTIIKDGNQYSISQIITDTGVFRVNNGVATFISVDTSFMVETEGYIVLNRELNRGGITMHDRIISDTQSYMVYSGQLVH